LPNNPRKEITGKAFFHPTIQTVGFQTAFSVNTLRGERQRKLDKVTEINRPLLIAFHFTKRGFIPQFWT
jgi:hypothetical protein